MNDSLRNELIDFLYRVRDELDGYIDIRDGEDGPLPNWAMQLCTEIDGNEYQRGLIEKVEKA